ncbi:MAG: hypothetical protein ACKO3B_07620, partial [Bacteroidota bacterium]
LEDEKISGSAAATEVLVAASPQGITSRNHSQFNFQLSSTNWSEGFTLIDLDWPQLRSATAAR